MILGVYWYFGFPEGLYAYEYFTFRKGLGGHVDAPAELSTTVEADHADSVIHELQELVAQYKDAFVFIYKNGNSMQISIGGYCMHDYEFELALKVEAVLQSNHVKKVSTNFLKDSELIRLSNEEGDSVRMTKKHFQLVGTSLRKYNAETASIRLDCNVDEQVKNDFLEEVKSHVASCKVDVVFYSEKKYEDRLNLMLFFTNGRQGLGLMPKQRVDVELFERTMDALIQKYAVGIGHAGGWDFYPIGEKIVLKIVDEEFILEPKQL